MTLNEASEKCEELIELIDDNIDEISERGIKFYEGVRETLMSMDKQFTKMANDGKHDVSDRQATALENMERGLRAWIE